MDTPKRRIYHHPLSCKLDLEEIRAVYVKILEHPQHIGRNEGYIEIMKAALEVEPLCDSCRRTLNYWVEHARWCHYDIPKKTKCTCYNKL